MDVKMNYNSIFSRSNDIKSSRLIHSFFTLEQLEDHLCEIYSYLGSLELLYHYPKDYERQLYELFQILVQESNDLTSFLNQNQFYWRQDQFASLKKYKNWLEKTYEKTKL